jgi:hypothetical protein
MNHCVHLSYLMLVATMRSKKYHVYLSFRLNDDPTASIYMEQAL